NRVIIVKPHNKTPYELFRGRPPTLSFMRPFGCHVSILNTLDHLGKFDGKPDDGFFVGYSLTIPTGRVVVPTGMYVVPAGKVIIIVSPGRLNLVPTGRILSPGKVK
ncbi:hypothetical protein Tco_0165189, partial [Tanacetum coccineum]